MAPRVRCETPRLVLASASTRRRQLLSALGLSFTVADPDIEEDHLRTPAKTPEELAEALALSKARAVHRQAEGAMVLGADTLVCLGEKVLGKPGGAEEAGRMLRALRGRRHRVITGLALIPQASDTPLVRHLSTIVTMRRYSEAEVEEYIASGDPLDKAGAYAVQSPTFRPAARVEGCYFNVVGLPICIVAEMLRQGGIQPRPDPRLVSACKYRSCPFRP